MLEEGDVSFKGQPELPNILGKLCRQLKTIPDSRRIDNCPTVLGDEECSGGNAAVSRGEYRGRTVAIYISSNFRGCFGVSAIPRYS